MASPATIRLTVPAPDRYKDPTVELRPAALKTWVDQLPYANSHVVIEQLTHRLSRLNRFPDVVKSRFEIMGCYQQGEQRLTEEDAATREQWRLLIVEMAHGYKHLVNEQQASSRRASEQLLATAIYWAMHYLSQLQLMIFEDYDCKNTRIWRELTALYRLAEQKELLTLPISDPFQTVLKQPTIDHQFKRIVLLATLDSCQLRATEISVCYLYLNLHAETAQLMPLNAQQQENGRFLVDTRGLRLPSPYRSKQTFPEEEQHHYRLLNVTPFSQRLHQDLQQLQKDYGIRLPAGLQQLQGASEAAHLLRRLLQTWHLRPTRQSERSERYGWMLVHLGLDAVHHGLQPQQSSLIEPEPLPIQDGAAEEIVLSSVSKEKAQPAKTIQAFRWYRINRSEGGVALRVRLPCKPMPEVGHLLLLKDESEPTAEPRIGIIRRCMKFDAKTLELGVQFVRGLVLPVTLQMLKEQEGTAYRALLVKRGKAEFDSILIAQGGYQAGSSYQVNGLPQQKSLAIIADKQLETGSGFERFSYQVFS